MGWNRLCEALAESFPPQCGGASLIVEGLVLGLVAGLERSGGVQRTNFSIQVARWGRGRDDHRERNVAGVTVPSPSTDEPWLLG